MVTSIEVWKLIPGKASRGHGRETRQSSKASGRPKADPFGPIETSQGGELAVFPLEEKNP